MGFHFDFKGIMEGAWNSVFVKERVEKIAEIRTEICSTCPHESENRRRDDPMFDPRRPDKHFCTLCGCNLHMKTRSLSQICPDLPPRWEAEITEKEEWELDHRLTEQ